MNTAATLRVAFPSVIARLALITLQARIALLGRQCQTNARLLGCAALAASISPLQGAGCLHSTRSRQTGRMPCAPFPRLHPLPPTPCGDRRYPKASATRPAQRGAPALSHCPQQLQKQKSRQT